ncbi:M48 family metallopeptidase [Streptomyces lydicus]|uniref:M48 family metallopeptidase n=1 Tax=Streptomyces lydicus TaxID=47763 RepID=UPI001F507365|nr:SprT family zinc-dependent metalloprotease [Streptomyces lydicus]MCZ1009050.1 SprT family zinc-dependent metalloprotease [Streptomyces lydicus]
MSRPSAPAAEGPGDERLAEGQTLVVDGLSLRVRVSARRARLGLTIERDASLTLRTPEECRRHRAEKFVRDNRPWIESKLLLSEERRQLHPVRSLYDGEIHRYLGRDYPLLLVDGPAGHEDDSHDGQGRSDAPVRLVAGRLRLSRSVAADPQQARKAIAAWYSRAGQRWVRGRLQPWAARMDVAEPPVEVRDLGHRWGTYRAGPNGGGRVALHWAVFQLPIHLIDYVIAHELAHVRVAGHGPDYWRLLGRALPECRRLKAELDELGRRVWMGDVGTQP